MERRPCVSNTQQLSAGASTLHNTKKPLGGRRKYKLKIPIYERSYKGSRMRVYLVREGRQKENLTISSPKDVYNLVKDHLCRSDREVFLSILLACDNSLIGVEKVAVGTLNQCIVSPRELFKSAILASAYAVILCHCHPSGSLNISREDKGLTEKIIAAGKTLGILVNDHVIVSHRGFISIRETSEHIF